MSSVRGRGVAPFPRGRGRGLASQRARGRGRGRGRGQPPKQESYLVNVGVLVRYADNSLNQGRYRWPSNTTEKQALFAILQEQSDKDLEDLMEVTFSQVPRPGVKPLEWLEKEPFGHYYFNQHLYGENGIQHQLNLELKEMQLQYDPDIEGIQFQGNLNDCFQQEVESKVPVGPRYDATVF